MSSVNTSFAMLQSALPLLLMLGAFFVLIVMPQRKKDKEYKGFLAALKKGDRVILNGGLIGSIEHIDTSHDVVRLVIAPDVVVSVEKTAIARAAA
jgi:preprotein translocase subunit YajC